VAPLLCCVGVVLGEFIRETDELVHHRLPGTAGGILLGLATVVVVALAR